MLQKTVYRKFIVVFWKRLYYVAKFSTMDHGIDKSSESALASGTYVEKSETAD